MVPFFTTKLNGHLFQVWPCTSLKNIVLCQIWSENIHDNEEYISLHIYCFALESSDSVYSGLNTGLTANIPVMAVTWILLC